MVFEENGVSKTHLSAVEVDDFFYEKKKKIQARKYVTHKNNKVAPLFLPQNSHISNFIAQNHLQDC